jgi:hypothetical protein
MKVTEVVSCILKPGTELKSGDAKEKMDGILATIRKQNNCLVVGSGTTLENPEAFDMIVGTSLPLRWNQVTNTHCLGWKDIQDHHNFTGSEGYKPFMAGALELLEPASLEIIHIAWAQDDKTVEKVFFQSPCVELLLLYVDANAGDEVQATVQEFLDTARAEGIVGALEECHGWVVEELEQEGKEGKFKGYFVCVGWESLALHREFLASDNFAKTRPIVGKVAQGIKVVSISSTASSSVC